MRAAVATADGGSSESARAAAGLEVPRGDGGGRRAEAETRSEGGAELPVLESGAGGRRGSGGPSRRPSPAPQRAASRVVFFHSPGPTGATKQVQLTP